MLKAKRASPSSKWMTVRRTFFSSDRLSALSSAIEEVSKREKAIVLVGRTSVFSAGLDLDVVRAGGADATRQLLVESSRCLISMLSAPIPMVAASTGHAMALGAILLTACDWRVGASGDFKIGVPATRNGITLTLGFISLLRARLNTAFQFRSILASEIFDPSGAIDSGFYDDLADPDAVKDVAFAKAKVLGAMPNRVYAAHKAALNKHVIDVLSSAIPG